MVRRAEIETVVGGTDAGIRNVDGLGEAFKRLGKTGQSAGAMLRDAQKEWQNPGSLATQAVKLGAQILGQQINAAAEAITAPAKTSYGQAIARANEHRDATQRISTSIGKSYEETGNQILGTAGRLGLMPERVQSYGRSVRRLTGDWEGAAAGLEGYQSRALKTDRTLEEMIPTASTLARTFGIKATDDVNLFFGTLDKQAKGAKVSAEVAERAFLNASGMLSSLTNAKPQQLTALTAAVLGGAPTAEMGEQRLGAIGGLLQGHTRYIEGRMRRAGKLKKGEHIYDEQGQIKGNKLFDTLEFVQSDLAKFYGTKDRQELIGRISQSGMMSMQDAAGLLGLDVKSLRKSASDTAKAPNTAKQFLSTAGGTRAYADAQKDINDILFGATTKVPGMSQTLLEQQDAAVRGGGGKAGIVMAAAPPVITAARGLFTDENRAKDYEQEMERRKQGKGRSFGFYGLSDTLLEDSARAARGFNDVASYRQYRSSSGVDVTTSGSGRAVDVGASPELLPKGGPGQAQGSGAGGGQPGLTAQSLADALAKAIAGQTLRVQPVMPPVDPPGRGQPL